MERQTLAIRDKIKLVKTIQQFLRESITAVSDGISFDILVPPDRKLGDYSTNIAFVIAKKEGRKPFDVANELKEKLKSGELNSVCEIKPAPNGYLNFFLKPEFLQKQLVEINKDDNYGAGAERAEQKVIVEYSSPNIAKPMHIGHLRSTIIGDALANVYAKLGYKVIRWNYLGDWGTQFGKLIAADKRWHGDLSAMLKDPIQEMLRLYVKFHEEEKNNPELEKEGQEEFKKLESGDKNNIIIWRAFRSASLAAFRIIFNQLGIDPNKFITKGESDYEPRLKPLIAELEKKGIAKESEGALIIDLEKYKLPPGLLRKSDGATLYLTRDIASLEDRLQNYDSVKKILYVVANQQTLHFEQLFAVAKELKMDSAELVHVKFGMVLGEDGKKLATREGKVVPLQEVINKITALAYDTVKQKNPDLSEDQAKEVARTVGIGALKYNDLKQHPYSDIVFDWKAMLDLSGNSGPYVQYTYVRLRKLWSDSSNREEYDVSQLTHPLELEIIKKLLDFPSAISQSAERYTLNTLALYLYELSVWASRYYETVRILSDTSVRKQRNARLLLTETVARTIKDGLSLLGIGTLERI